MSQVNWQILLLVTLGISKMRTNGLNTGLMFVSLFLKVVAIAEDMLYSKQLFKAMLSLGDQVS